MKEIEVLETASGESRTKPATKFNGPFLKGLFHKHHMEDGLPSLSQNLLNALKTYGLPDFERLSIEAEKEGRVVSLDDINAIVNEAVLINYQRRANDQQLTGEWIIFAQHKGENYYLCLGKHGQDEKIRSEIDALCVLEFPFLNEILPQIEGGIH
ncbi:hypothetical protein JOS77_06820 [Chromobacterium haemolyticum]|nr:hypothetical protein JOS77_06820 [Chromobacterium haemolyticum]